MLSMQAEIDDIIDKYLCGFFYKINFKIDRFSGRDFGVLARLY